MPHDDTDPEVPFTLEVTVEVAGFGRAKHQQQAVDTVAKALKGYKVAATNITWRLKP